MKDCKIYVDGRSREVQKKLFELGCEWELSGKTITHEGKPFLFVVGNVIKQSDNMEIFSNQDVPEIKVYELLSMKVELYTFKTGEEVLVRDEDDDNWCYSLFSHYKAGDKYPYATGSGYFAQCIPYKGNEHLVGTTKDK